MITLRRIMNRDDHQRRFIADMAMKGAAIKNHGAMCSTCAFKFDSDANKEPHNVESAAQCVIFDLGVFHCHKEIDVDAGVPCKGFLNAKEYVNNRFNN